MRATPTRFLAVAAAALLSVGALAACGSGDAAADGSGDAPTLVISGIPDQDPELLTRRFDQVAARFSEATGLKVEYKPVTDYAAVVRGFAVGDIQVAWVGGLTGVQARAQVPGTVALAQRDIDSDFHSLFIAHASSGLQPFDDQSGLTGLAGHSFTFGSETSTSGRLMPQYFMTEAGLDLSDLKGSPGFSGSHDATIEAVASGSFEVGAVNEQVWQATVDSGEVDLGDVTVLWRTPGYADYHWVARPDIDEVYGAGTTGKIQDLLLGLDPANPDDKAVLDLFSAGGFVTTEASNYDQIEAVGKDLGLVG